MVSKCDKPDFKDFIKRDMLIFKNPEVFNETYSPEDIQKRKETYTLYKEIANFINYNLPNNLGLIGLTGTGKTVTVQHLLKQINKLSDKFIIKYVNCANKTSNQVLQLLLGSITNSKSISDENLIMNFTENLDTQDKNCFIVLDEIDRGRRLSNLVYIFSRINELYQEFKHKISLILISNDLNFLDNLDPAIRSSLNLRIIYFESYNKKEIKEILKDRIKIGFKNEQAINNQQLDYIADIIVKEKNGDCRTAIKTLFYSAKKAEEEKRDIIEDKDIQIMFDKAVKDIERSRVTKLTNTQLFILYSVIDSKDKQIKGIHQKYLEFTNKMKIESNLSEITIYIWLDYLVQQGLIERQFKIIKGDVPKREVRFNAKIKGDVVEEEINMRLLNLSKI